MAASIFKQEAAPPVEEAGEENPAVVQDSSAAGDAVNSRAELRRQQRLQKLEQLETYRQGRVERGLLWIEKSGLDLLANINYKRFYPKFGGLPTGSGLTIGTRYWNPNLKESFWDLQGSGSYSTRKYHLYELQFGEVQQQEKRLFFYANLRYRNFPQEDFFGLGPQSLREDRTSYRLEDASYGGVVGYPFKDWLRAQVRAEFLQVSIGRGTDTDLPDTGELFNDVSAPGLAEQPDFFRLSPAVVLDYRDRPGNPHRGGMLSFSFTRFSDVDGNEFDFNRFSVDVRHYLPVGSETRILALRFFTSLDSPDQGSRVPFYLQNVLGGSETMRGFTEFRFRDTHQLLLAAEYRWEAVPALEFALLYSAGKVFPDRREWDLHNLEQSYGLGVRMKTPGAVVFRIDAAYSHEGTHVYFKFRPSF